MTQLLTKIDVPADVPSSQQGLYEQNYQTLTKGTGNLMLFAGDQKVEHLNDDFYGTLSSGEAIHDDDLDPEHLFRIAKDGVIGCFAILNRCSGSRSSSWMASPLLNVP